MTVGSRTVDYRVAYLGTRGPASAAPANRLFGFVQLLLEGLGDGNNYR
jgi:hypothetical protein